jgi:hypothetical protein
MVQIKDLSSKQQELVAADGVVPAVRKLLRMT